MTTAPEQTSLYQRRAATVKEHVDAENRHDPDAVVATFSATRASYDIPAFGEAGQATDGASVRALWQGFIASFPDLNIVPGPLFQGEHHVFVEVSLTGTQRGDFAGIPPTGRSIKTRIGCLFEFEGDQLVHERVYLDLADILRQLGALPS